MIRPGARIVGTSTAFLILAAVEAGCESAQNFYNRVVNGDQQQVTPEQFVVRPGGPAAVDSGRPLSPISPVPVVAQPGPTPLHEPTQIDQAIASVVESNGATTQPSEPTTLPAEMEPTVSSGEYLPLGGVVAEVNGTPIYVNKVLQLVWPALRNDARSMDAEHFALAARDEIGRQIESLQAAELVYAAADRNLDDGDKKLVTDLTTQYRQQLITEAGGSVEVARRKAAANGDDFDQLVNEQQRHYMIELYQQRRFSPLVEPTAQDMRVYYQQNLDKQFTEHSEAVFDLIKIDPANLHSDTALQDRQLAFEQAKQARDRAAAGANFATLFQEYNDDPGLAALTNGTGNMGVMQRGSFTIPEVEDAVWKLQPQQVSDVIDVDGVLYVAKMESRKEGVVHPFEDEDVQNLIVSTIRRQRFALFYDEEKQRLMSLAVTSTNDQMLETAVDMAMQSYHAWTGR